ncbi:hypothetical protein M5K25_017592 [Dendrobium thyrsiflorum]|uniref:Uncharacterized protein n=1 Tax=Dendrobium thyrsiflorum TaxID=117978 RepID=A0ABD0UMN4_DENTH
MASTCLRSLNRSSLCSLRSRVSKANIAGRRPPPTNSSTAGYTRTTTGADTGTAFHSPIHRFRALSRGIGVLCWIHVSAAQRSGSGEADVEAELCFWELSRYLTGYPLPHLSRPLIEEEHFVLL